MLLDEMLTGEHVFNGETTSDTLAAVIKTEPNWDALPASIPASIRKMLRSVTPGLQARKRGSPDAYPDPLKGGSFRVGDDTGVGG